MLDYNKEWIDVIAQSRITGKEFDYDIIYDRIADNRFNEISDLLQAYYYKKMKDTEVINKIKWNNGNGDQYCFKTEKAVELLTLERKITYEKKGKVWYHGMQ